MEDEGGAGAVPSHDRTEVFKTEVVDIAPLDGTVGYAVPRQQPPGWKPDPQRVQGPKALDERLREIEARLDAVERWQKAEDERAMGDDL